MAFNFKMTRHSAIAQIVLGSLLVIFGIADRATMFDYNAFHSESVSPIWMGIWIVITGVIGFFGTSHKYADNGRPSPALIGTYLGFSVVAVVFAGVIIIMHTLGVINVNHNYACRHGHYYHHSRPAPISQKELCRTSVALGSMVIIFAILEFGFGILACICSCMNGCCGRSTQPGMIIPQMGQVVYIQTPEGPTAHVMTQGANGVPVAVPVQVNAVPQPQVIYPSPYTAGAAGGGAANAQAPPLETKHRELPPIYQP